MHTWLLFILIPIWATSPGLCQEPIDIGENYFFREKQNADGRVRVFYNSRTRKRLKGWVKTHVVIDENTLLSDVGYYARGKLNGVLKEYENDTLERVSYYKNGLKEGLQTEYWRKYKTTARFQKDRKHGLEQEFRNDSLQREVLFVEGIKSGTENYYNILGQVSATAWYCYDPEAAPPKLANNIPFCFLDSLPSRMFQDMMSYKGKLVISASTTVDADNYDDGFLIGSESLVWEAIDLDSFQMRDRNHMGCYFWVEYQYGSFDTLDGDEDWLVFTIFDEPGCRVNYEKVKLGD